MMKGISANVSITFTHLDFLLTINHAVGKPAIMSSVETVKAMAKDASIAELALARRAEFCSVSPIKFHFRITPIMGGIRMIAMKNMRATAYVVLLAVEFALILSSASRSFSNVLFLRGLGWVNVIRAFISCILPFAEIYVGVTEDAA